MKIHPAVPAPIVTLFFFAAVFAGNMWELPSMEKSTGTAQDREAEVEMIVDGLRCRGTSGFLIQRLEKLEGVTSVTTYVQEHRAVIRYDPLVTDVGRIRDYIDSPVRLNDGRMVRPFAVTEVLE